MLLLALVLLSAGLAAILARRLAPHAVTRTSYAFAAVLLGAAAALWYFGVYDTAEGRCGRGDLGACIVLEAQRASR